MGKIAPSNIKHLLVRLRAVPRRVVMQVLAVLLITAIAGPDVGLSMEMFALLDGLGAELFLFSFVVGLRLYFHIACLQVRLFFERKDPYFFIPSRQQVATCPGIIVHAIPGFIILTLLAIGGPSMVFDA